jgi:SAM-dependent methyltransferase
MDFYRFVEAYDLVFSGRDYPVECNFLRWCFEDKNRVKLKSVLEVACGPAHHARYLAREGLTVSALDLSTDMINYAEKLSAQQGIEMNHLTGDMVQFNLNQKYDLILNLNESITHILTNDDFVKHLNSVYDALNSRGVYIIETAHPAYFFPEDEPNFYKVKKGKTEVELLFGTPDDYYDPVSQIWKLTTEVRIKENGKLIEEENSFSYHRWYLSRELEALIKLNGKFKEFSFFGSMSLPPLSLDDDESDCMIIVLYK